MTKVLHLLPAIYLLLIIAVPHTIQSTPDHIQLSDKEEALRRTTYLYYLNRSFIASKIHEFGTQRSLPDHGVPTLDPDKTLLVLQHEAGFSYGKASRTILYTDNIIDCIAGTIWNPRTQTGCLFHFDRYCAPESVNDALLTIADGDSYDSLEITLTSSYLSPHFFTLKSHILAEGYLIKHYDFYNGYHVFSPNSHQIGNKNVRMTVDTFHIYYDPHHWCLEFENTLLKKVGMRNQYGYPRRVALDVVNGKVYHEAFIEEDLIEWQRRSRKAWWTHWLLEIGSSKLHYVNEHKL